MKVLLVNGSPKANGCTHAALEVVAGELAKCGIDTEIFWCGNKPIMGCIGCGKCSVTKRCWYDEDTVNRFLEKVDEADGFVFGTPIHLPDLLVSLSRLWTGRSAARRRFIPTSRQQL